MISDNSDKECIRPRDAAGQPDGIVPIEMLSQPKCFKKDCSMNTFTRCSLICPGMLSMAVMRKQCLMLVASMHFIIINADSSDSKSKQYLAARTQ